MYYSQGLPLKVELSILIWICARWPVFCETTFWTLRLRFVVHIIVVREYVEQINNLRLGFNQFLQIPEKDLYKNRHICWVAKCKNNVPKECGRSIPGWFVFVEIYSNLGLIFLRVFFIVVLAKHTTVVF